jgi:hypothetical protein
MGMAFRNVAGGRNAGIFGVGEERKNRNGEKLPERGCGLLSSLIYSNRAIPRQAITWEAARSATRQGVYWIWYGRVRIKYHRSS